MQQDDITMVTEIPRASRCFHCLRPLSKPSTTLPPVANCSNMQVTQSNAGITHTVILRNVLEIMFMLGIKISSPHIPRNIKLMPNWYEEMKPHMPLNKTIRFVHQALAEYMNLSETRQRNREWVSARETDREDKQMWVWKKLWHEKAITVPPLPHTPPSQWYVQAQLPHWLL